MTTGMGSHQSAVALTHTWLTPPHILAALGPFDLDPCAAPEPRPWATADRHITLPADGLTVRWHGRVWLNPPYGPETGAWLERLAAHGHGTALVFARTETTWFHLHVWPHATGLLFLRGRLRFHRPDGTMGSENGGAPSVLVAYGPGDANRLRLSGIDGAWVHLPGKISGIQGSLFDEAA